MRNNIPCGVPKFKRGVRVPIKMWIEQMEYYFSITGVPERKHIMGMIKHIERRHFPEVQPYKSYNYPEFHKKIIRIFKTPDLTHVNIDELMSGQAHQDETLVYYMDRVQDNVAKAFPKLPDANRQNLSVVMFCQGGRDHDVARMTAIQATGDFASAPRIAASAMAFGKELRHPERY